MKEMRRIVSFPCDFQFPNFRLIQSINSIISSELFTSLIFIFAYHFAHEWYSFSVKQTECQRRLITEYVAIPWRKQVPSRTVDRNYLETREFRWKSFVVLFRRWTIRNSEFRIALSKSFRSRFRLHRWGSDTVR